MLELGGFLLFAGFTFVIVRSYARRSSVIDTDLFLSRRARDEEVLQWLKSRPGTQVACQASGSSNMGEDSVAHVYAEHLRRLIAIERKIEGFEADRPFVQERGRWMAVLQALSDQLDDLARSGHGPETDADRLRFTRLVGDMASLEEAIARRENASRDRSLPPLE